MEKTKNFLLKSLFTLFIAFTVGLAVSQTAFAGNAGTVTFTTGDVSIVRADKTVVKAAKNDAVNVGDTIETKTGRLQLSFVDGGKVSLQPNTVYKINKYEFSGKEDGSEYAFTELLKGGLRTISGLIGHKNRERYQLKTAVATIGIRGTEFTVNFNNNQLLMTTNHGSVDVCNAGGCLNATTGQSIGVAGVGEKPKPSDIAAQAAATAPAKETKTAANETEKNSEDAGSEQNVKNTVLAVLDSSKSTYTVTDTVTNTGVPSIVQESSDKTVGIGLQNYLGQGFASVVMKTDDGNGVNGVLDLENLETNANSQPINMNTAGNAIDIHPNLAFSSYNSDGIVAWGRTYGGTVTVSPGNGIGAPGTSETMQWMDYAIGTKPDPVQLANFSGSYEVFGSTAPMFVSSSGASSIIGQANDVVGNFTFDFATTDFRYGLSVITVGETYNLSGGGNLLANNPTFSSNNGQSSVVSQGGSCFLNSCVGAINGNKLIQGAFFGKNGERIGLQYGFSVNSLNGSIYGTAVLKSPQNGGVQTIVTQ